MEGNNMSETEQNIESPEVTHEATPEIVTETAPAQEAPSNVRG